MAETVLENEICNACQAEVRPESLFCYNCGESVTDEPIGKPDDVLIKNEIDDEEIEVEQTELESFDSEETENGDNDEAAEIGGNSEGNAIIISNEEIEQDEKSGSASKKNIKLRSAAALKKSGKKIKTKEVIVTWEEYENAPNAWFITIALLLTLFAVGVFFAAMYLR